VVVLISVEGRGQGLSWGQIHNRAETSVPSCKQCVVSSRRYPSSGASCILIRFIMADLTCSCR